MGDSGALLDHVFGGMFGAGTIERIVRGYTFISRNYAEGDNVYIVGFSRGAYTARALGGLIADMGLLNNANSRLDDKSMAYRLGAMVWRVHRSKRLQVRAANSGDAGLIATFSKMVDVLPHFVSRDPESDDLIPSRNNIRAIAVWDTVGSLGIPLYLNDDERVDVFRFADTALSEKVGYGFHAISLDEQRDDFEPTLWDKRHDVCQVLFPGAHADVGGGYPTGQTGLSDGALVWMASRLATLGVRFRSAPSRGDPAAPGHRPWAAGVFASLRHGPRKMLEGKWQANDLRLHCSVQQRLKASPTLWMPSDGSNKYSPTVLCTAIADNTVWEQP